MTDLILHNAKIYTVDSKQPWVEAVAIDRGLIMAGGNNDQVLALAGPATQIIDLNGRSVTPGFIDAHLHFQKLALSLQWTNLFELPSFDQVLERVARDAANKGPNEWLRGWGWTRDIWPGQTLPTAADLDRVAPHGPVYLDHKAFGHGAWVNSRALQLAGIEASTPDPPGGKIQRDANGRPTGILFEEATKLVSKHIPPATETELIKSMRVAQEHCWRTGLTGFHDFDGRACFEALQTMRQNGDLGLRVVKNIPVYRMEYAIGVGLRSGFGDDWLRIGGVKIFADGALGTRSALMVEPYEGEPDNYGIATTDKEEMKELVSRASAHSFSLTIHAIGDKAIHDVLDVYEAVRVEEAARGEPPDRLRHIIEHVQLYHPADRQRLAKLNLIASMQPVHVNDDMQAADQFWGERSRYTHAWRDMLNTGATLAFGSDAPYAPVEPILGLVAAVTRRRPDGAPGPEGWYPQQRLTITEAVHAFTRAAAVASRQEARKGSVTPGKLADLTIFERDIFTIPHAELPEVKIAGTIVNGQFKYRAIG